ncbi:MULTISPECIES: PLP-dependent aminotransferase family protein [Microbacterium]|uniref:MocR-like transcription factor YczR n=1 Tax=Microbacterium TaxID=33882 RepID=UPI00277EDBB4|nr:MULTISPECIES: PLP-dependent aminotransferase family protein [Microbacterium]MDQ1084048.1 DNA-binding transcriptional MocR family regulator [Microbacterium sp. SORGH_AS_0344]MDQ1170673.1 DNA-binding transcriptional MocR family regulator [Microbacterium proteolyticum]
MDSRISARALTSALGGWRGSGPAYEALADGVRLLCLDNRLAPSTALPAERELAATLGLSRTTVAAAYRSLRESGHIESLRGSGSVTLPLRRSSPAVQDRDGAAIDLQQASPAAWPGLPGIIAEVAQDAPALVARIGYDVVGDSALRAAIAEHYDARGLPTSPEQILVTTGAQSAIHLIASVLLGRADRVMLETPTYPHAADAFRRAGARLIGVPVDSVSGWDLERAAQSFARALPTLAYLMPDFHNPTGRTMTPGEVSAFVTAAQSAGTLLVLDETTAQLDIDREAGPAPFPDDERILRVASLGKTVWGGLRVGWVRAAPDLVRRLASGRPVNDLGTPEIEQAIALRLVPRLDEIARQRGDLLRAGRDALSAALRRTLPEWEVPDVNGGVSLWVGLGEPLSTPLVMNARARGLALSAGSRFAVEGGHDRRLRVPFTAPPATLERAVEVLHAAWADVRGGRTSPVREEFATVV